jgi:uncharacterized protein YjiS (DUF1127 family)
MYGLLVAPSAYEFHLHARHEQRLAMHALFGHAASEFAKWISSLAGNGARLAQRLAAERRLRRDIRVLQALQDRELSDMGLVRSEIEHFVRYGRPDAADLHLVPQRDGQHLERNRQVERERLAA